MDFKLFVDALLTGTPLAILAALVGVVWQLLYTRSRDRLRDEQTRQELELEKRRFEYQKELEQLRFEYETRRWRQELARGMTQHLVEARIEECARIWSHVESIAIHRLKDGELSAKETRELAGHIKEWRYSKGGLLAETTTRDVIFAFQTALWEYDGTQEAFKRVRRARRLFRNALRAEIGLGEDTTGQTVYEIAEKRQKIREELDRLRSELNLTDESL